MPTPTIPAGNLFMNASTYTGTGNGVSQTINNGAAGASFQPDLVWVKSRSGVADHVLFDVIRGFGGNKELSTNNTQSEGQGDTSSYGYVSAANSNGFTVTAGSVNAGYVNSSGVTYVGWQWKAGGAAVTNNVGSISSQVSANTTSGFSVVTYTGTGSNATVGHGLGVAPSMIIVKRRDSATNGDWFTYHASLGNANAIYLNLTNASGSSAGAWNNTSPTSSVFTVGTSTGVNASASTYVAYCWAPIAGYSAFGSYTGNGSTDGTFVYLGFRPKFIITKKSSSTEDWAILDSSRSPYNITTANLYADLSGSEDSVAIADLLSNGIKFRAGGGQWNLNGATYIYMAFAENPFKYSLAR